LPLPIFSKLKKETDFSTNFHPYKI
jgi:hypothetical protein